MSPSRTRKPVVHGRPRSEVITAVAVAAGITLGTALIVWLMRPGPAGGLGGGGLVNRQPRATWLILLSIAVGAGLVWWVLYGRRRPRRLSRRAGVASVLTVTVVGAVLGGIFWPGGLVHHWPKAFKPPAAPPTNSTTPTTTPTTKPGNKTTSTTAKGPKTSTTASASTTTKP
ncbi:MAG TPA: hypothetical protein VFR41_11730 [Acidimicrobiia bacterium]|nr:hypothetical protein [Acidimicrobiia bacterium]